MLWHHKAMQKLALVAFVVVLLSCSPPTRPNEKLVSKQNYGQEWPLTVESGTLACSVLKVEGYNRVPLKAVTIEVNGVKYAVNGTAGSHKLGKDIDEIWAPGDPKWIEHPETKEKVNIGPPKKDIGGLVQDGLKLCANLK